MGLFRRRADRHAPGRAPGQTGRRTAGAGEITVYTRAGCHLCQDALAIVDTVAAEHRATVVAIDIDTDPELQRRWSDQVPVVLVGGQIIGVWRVDRRQLQVALSGDD